MMAMAALRSDLPVISDEVASVNAGSESASNSASLRENVSHASDLTAPARGLEAATLSGRYADTGTALVLI